MNPNKNKIILKTNNINRNVKNKKEKNFKYYLKKRKS
jgi:hypothetical protein